METSKPQTFDLDEDESPASSSDASKSRRSRQPWLWLLMTLLLVGGGIAVWCVFTSVREPSSPTAAQQLPPSPVETVTIARGDGVRRIRLLGQVEASKSATVRTQTAGIVERVLVDVGDRVSPGIPVAILDDADQRLAVAEAQATLAQERSELARLEVGTRREIIAQRQAELRSAQARPKKKKSALK